MKFDGPLLEERWRLGPRMGHGAQGNTYLARDERHRGGERVVVLKQFHLRKGDWKKFDLFEREARVLKSLRHPGIPRFLSSFESEPGVFNLVMERKPGATLRSIATRVQFTDGELRDVLGRVLVILEYLHHRSPPVIHRDIKPANLVRDVEGNIALVDFGGVRDVLREGGGSTVIGTFGYMAPEQLHGQATAATDIYGLGATIVALAGGVEPESVPRRGLRMDLKKHLAGRDPGLVEVLEAMTEPDPDARPQSARVVSRMLAERMRAAARPLRTELVPATVVNGSEPKPFEELGDLLDEVPQPVDAILRVLLLAFSVGGYVAVTVVQSVLLPVLFGLILMMSDKDSRPRIAATRSDARRALEQGRQGLRNLQARCLRGDDAPKQLPK